MKKTYYYIFLFLSILTTSLYFIFNKKTAKTTWLPKNDELINNLHPKIRSMAADFVNEVEKELNIQLKVTSTLRTFEEQAALYAKGRTKSGGVVTNAEPGESYHNYGLALDVFDSTNQTFHISEKIALIGESKGFKWGGRWANLIDKPHFEKSFGLKTSELLSRYRNNNVDSSGYVNI